MSYLGFCPPAVIFPYAGTSAPEGWLLCDGSAVSRTVYATLFSSIGTSYGSGDGSTTFNLPDYRWTFLRGYGPQITATGSGTAASNQATFTNHGFNRSGIKVRMTSGALTGLSLNTDYWVIVVNSNTLAFATSKANAISNTRVTISGTTTAVISQWEDPDVSSRGANSSGANSGANVGSFQADDFKSHTHNFQSSHLLTGTGAFNRGSEDVDNTATATHVTLTSGGNETRPSNVSVNYIIKI